MKILLEVSTLEYYKVIDRLTSDVKRPFTLDDKLARIDDTPVHKALRECLANALIHADYYGRRGIVVDKEFRKVTISNPGTFRIGVDEAIAGGISDARNVIIFNMFSLINVGERSGIGLCDVYNTCKAYGYKEPEIVETVEPDRITLTLEIESRDKTTVTGTNDVAFGANRGANDENGANCGANDKNGANRGANEELATNETSIMEYIKNYPNVSSNAIAVALSIPLRTVQRSLTNMQKSGLIRNDGSRKKSIWVIDTGSK